MDQLSEIDKSFWKFHKENPEVFKQIVSLANQAKSRGRTKIGMKMLFEVIRWNKILQTRGDAYKLNNNYTSRYARILADEHPDLGVLFETRRIHS